MVKWFLNSLVAGLAVAVGGVAQAAIVAPLNYNNAINELEDVDYESHIDVNGNGLVDEDDLLVAMIVFDKNNTLSNVNTTNDPIGPASPTSDLFFDYSETTNTFTGVSLLRIADVIVTGAESATYILGAASSSDWTTYTGLTGIDAGVAAVMFDDAPATPPDNEHIEAGKVDVATSIATATEGTRLWEFGFAGAGTFWIADVEADGGNPLVIDDITDLDFLASLNIIDDNGFSGILAQHRTLADPDLSSTAAAALFAVPTHLQLQGNGETGGAGVFQLKTDTNAYLHTTPEPASMVVWAGLAGLGLMASRRFRRTRKSA